MLLKYLATFTMLTSSCFILNIYAAPIKNLDKLLSKHRNLLNKYHLFCAPPN